MAKIIIVRSCDDCTGIPCFCEMYNPDNPIPKNCPLTEAPAVMVYKHEPNWKPEEGNFYDAVFDALEYMDIPAYLKKV